MKTRAFGFMIIAIILGAAAFAGGASDIDNCCYVDRQCNTDLEWIGGWHAYQAGQCSAPSRAPASSQPAVSASAQIDNCCYVDRQCNTELDWIGGWHAYQAGQCSAPAGSPAPASSQPAGGAPTQVDNCCYVDRQCSTDLDWMGGWHAYRAGQCGATGQSQTVASSQPTGGGLIHRTANGIVVGYARGRGILPSTTPNLLPDGQSISTNRGNCCEWDWQCNNDQDWAEGFRQFQTHFHCALPGLISIVGDADFVDFYAQRLDELKNRLPHRYDYVLNGLDRIEQLRADDTSAYIDGRHRAFNVPWDGPLVSGWEKRRSAVLVHEACHLLRVDAGHSTNVCDREAWIREEVFCRELELQVVIELDTQPDVTEWVRGMVERTRSGEAYWRPERICD